MRTICFIMLFNVMFSCTWAQLSPSATDTCAGYELIDGFSYNFGDVCLSDDSISHSFWILSSKPVPLIVISCSTTCPCTDVHCSQDVIEYGDSLEVKVIYHPYALGPFSQSAVLKTNVCPYRYIRLYIEGNVVESKNIMKN